MMICAAKGAKSNENDSVFSVHSEHQVHDVIMFCASYNRLLLQFVLLITN